MALTPVQLSADDFSSAIGNVYTSGLTSLSKEDNNTKGTVGTSAFDTILNAAVDMYKEADTLQKKAEETEMSFALGYTDSIHDLAVAQQKANISLQYTVKVTNAVVAAYKELMNMQL